MSSRTCDGVRASPPMRNHPQRRRLKFFSTAARRLGLRPSGRWRKPIREFPQRKSARPIADRKYLKKFCRKKKIMTNQGSKRRHLLTLCAAHSAKVQRCIDMFTVGRFFVFAATHAVINSQPIQLPLYPLLFTNDVNQKLFLHLFCPIRVFPRYGSIQVETTPRMLLPLSKKNDFTGCDEGFPQNSSRGRRGVMPLAREKPCSGSIDPSLPVIRN